MADVWPATLPQKFNEEGYSEGMGKNLIRSNMDAGPAKVRRRTTSAVRPMSGTMQMTSTQLQDLVEFYETTIMHGSLPFEFPNPRDAGVLLVRFADDGLTDWRPNGYGEGEQMWSVPIRFEVLP